MTEQHIWGIAHQAAELLPEPPAPHDAFGYLAWEELVVTTARRLSRVVEGESGSDSEPCPRPQPVTLALSPRWARLDAGALLALAALVDHDDVNSCELVLARTVEQYRAETGRVNSLA